MFSFLLKEGFLVHDGEKVGGFGRRLNGRFEFARMVDVSVGPAEPAKSLNWVPTDEAAFEPLAKPMDSAV